MAAGRTAVDPSTGYSSSQLDGYESLFRLITNESADLTEEEVREQDIWDCYRADTYWLASAKAKKRVLKKDGLHIFRMWGNTASFELKYKPPSNSYPKRQSALPANIPAPIEQTAVECTRPAHPAPVLKLQQQPEVQRSPMDLTVQQKADLWSRIKSVNKECQRLYAILQNPKTKPGLRAHYQVQLVWYWKELSLDWLQLKQPSQYWQKLLDEEAIRGKGMTPAQVRQIPNLEELLASTIVSAEVQRELECIQGSLTNDPFSEETQALRERIEREDLAWFVPFYRKEIQDTVDPPPKEEHPLVVEF